MDFSKIKLDRLENVLSKVFIEDLELATDSNVDIDGDVVHVKIVDPIYKDFCSEVKKATAERMCKIGCPMCSSIACAVTKITGKPVIIERAELRLYDKTIETWFRLHRG